MEQMLFTACAQTLNHNIWRNLATLTTKLILQNAMGAPNATSITSFRALQTKIRDAFATYYNPYVCIDVLLAWGTTKFDKVYINHAVRESGRSNYTFSKLITHTFNMLTGFSTFPLQFASLNGLVCMFLGGILLVYVLVKYLIEGGVVPGFSFLASIIIIFSGAQLLALGVIGEYIGRIHTQSMNKPTYVISDETGQIAAPLEDKRKSLLNL